MKPSSVRCMWEKLLPRTVNSLRRSSPVATPGRTWTALSGSSVRTPRRFWMSALPSTCWAGAPGSAWRNRSALTVTASVVARASGQRDRQIQRHPCRERDVTLDERIAHDRRAQPARARRQRQLEAAINRRHRRRTALALRDVGDEHPAERRPGRGIDNQSPDGCRELALLSFKPRRGQKGQQKGG